MDTSKIRNFSIIAHIDHGKSTLADRLLLDSGAISKREFRDQLLDDMELERERGITIKARAVRLFYKEHMLNLIDTPGHIDFTYEVSKSLAACEGVLLLVDAGQGVEAQTMTNLYLALERDLVIIPIVTKIDLPAADKEKVAEEICNILDMDIEDIIYTSAKSGEGASDVFEAIINRIPKPQGDVKAPLKALIFDSIYDNYRGVVTYIRVIDGVLKKGDVVQMMQIKTESEVLELGILNPREEKVNQLHAGQVGYVVSNIKKVSEVKIGDTITLKNNPAKEPLPGYEDIQPMVFCGMYPVNSKDFSLLREALDKMLLNDSSFQFEAETSASLGFGFRCGFLGLLHMDVIQERLEREFNLELIITAPSVVYQILQTNGSVYQIENPTKMPDPSVIETIEEPYIRANIMIPPDSMGGIMKLAQERRGIYKSTEYLDTSIVLLVYELPLSEIVMDFNDKIKSITSGYGSFNYELIGYKAAKLVKMDILINSEPVDALSCIVVKENAHFKGKSLVEKLKEVIPRQMFEVSIQAAIGAKIVARESVAALRKNVTEKCYGGDITRKRKLIEKQKEGKKRMKRVGRVDLPQEAFISILKVE